MNSYTNIFGGDNVHESALSYKAYAITADLYLVWPFEALDGANVMASKIDVSTAVGGLSVYLPDARSASVGEDVLISNTGGVAFTLRDYDGNTLVSIAANSITSGIEWFVYLTDNTTTAGVWRVVQFAAGTSSANAAALAGAGLRANVQVLDQHLPTTPLMVGRHFAQNARAVVTRNGGGAVNYTFDSATVLGNGWFTYIINGGSGAITLDPNAGETIDGNATKTVNLGESLIVFSDGANLWSLGYGRSVSTNVTGGMILVGGLGIYNLSPTEILYQVQDFAGTLTGPREVHYGTGIGYWFVYNGTNGAFPLRFKTEVADDGVVVPQGSFSILRSNGSNMEIAFSATAGTVTEVRTAENELTGGPITTNGEIGLADTAVDDGTYGGDGILVAFQVDTKGRLIHAEQAQLNVKDSADFTSAQLADVVTDATGEGINVPSTAKLVFNESPTIIAPTMSDPVLTGVPTTPTPVDPHLDDTTVANTEFVTASVAAAVAEGSAALTTLLPGFLFGLALNSLPASATFGVAAGSASDSTGGAMLNLPTPFTKTTSAWALGTGTGALDTGVIANNTWYHVFIIRRPDTDVRDILISLSATAPTLPASYTQFRRLGSIQTNGIAQWVEFVQRGNNFYRAERLDWSFVATQPLTLSTLSVPTGVVVEPFTYVNISGGQNLAPHVTYAAAANINLMFVANIHYEGDSLNGSSSLNSIIGPPTNLLGQFYIGVPLILTGAGMTVVTTGWCDSRGRDG